MITVKLYKAVILGGSNKSNELFIVLSDTALPYHSVFHDSYPRYVTDKVWHILKYLIVPRYSYYPFKHVGGELF